MKKYFFLYLFLISAIVLNAQENEPAYYIHSIYFGGGSYYIDYQQVQELYNFLDQIPGIESHEITVHSHTDNIGGLEYNEWLSKMRSHSTIQRLLQKNIPKENISIQDFGELNPVYDNSTMEGKLKNRRVDVILKPLVL